MRCWKTGENFLDVLKEDEDIIKYLGDGELEKIFDYKSILEKIDFIFEKIGIEK
jgi:adenylosuccinate lyase